MSNDNETETLPAPAAAPEAPEPDALQRLAREIGVPSLFLLEPGVKAALPFELHMQ